MTSLGVAGHVEVATEKRPAVEEGGGFHGLTDQLVAFDVVDVDKCEEGARGDKVGGGDLQDASWEDLHSAPVRGSPNFCGE